MDLEDLLQDWIDSDLTLKSHFTIHVDPSFKISKIKPNWAYIASSIDTICSPNLSPVLTRAYFALGAARKPRYLPDSALFQRPIAFIFNNYIELRQGHQIGLLKQARFYPNDPAFFIKLKKAMYLMHKVEFGKSCEFKSSDP